MIQITTITKKVTFVALLVAIFSNIFGGCGGSGRYDNSYNPNDPNRPATGVAREQREVCCSQSAPSGFIKFNDKYVGSTDSCPAGDLSARNMCMYVRYDNLQSGDELVVCLGQPIPTGWSEVASSRTYEAGRCGGNPNNQDNIVTIRKN